MGLAVELVKAQLIEPELLGLTDHLPQSVALLGPDAEELVLDGQLCHFFGGFGFGSGFRGGFGGGFGGLVFGLYGGGFGGPG